MPKLKHPTSGTVVDVSEGRAGVLRNRGYTDAADSRSDLPAKSDPKQEWVDYAVSQGVAWDEAAGMTKAELVETFGG